jgi:hypothetical protein
MAATAVVDVTADMSISEPRPFNSTIGIAVTNFSNLPSNKTALKKVELPAAAQILFYNRPASVPTGRWLNS